MPRTREESWDISKQLRALLKKKRWSQTRLARETGISREDINRFAAKENPRKAGLARAQRMADALEVTVLDLGVPPEDAGEVGRTFASRLEALEGRAGDAEQTLERVLAALVAANIALPEPPAAHQSSATAPRRQQAKKTG